MTLEIFYMNIGCDYDDVIRRLGLSGRQQILLRFVKSFCQDDAMYKLAEAIQCMDYARIEKLAHSFKGSCLNLGFQKLYDLAFTLEIACHNNEFDRIDDIFGNLKREYDFLINEYTLIC